MSESANKPGIIRKIFYFIWSILATILVYTVGAVFTAFFCFIAGVFAICRWKGAVYVSGKLWAITVFSSMLKFPRVKGREKMEKGKRYLICVNHSSLFDIPAIHWMKQDLPAWVAKSSLFSVPFLGWVMSRGIAIPVDRDTIKKAVRTVEQNVKKVSQTSSVVIFPEGTRTKTGQLGDFKRGFIRIARQNQLDILPVTLNGFYNLKPVKRPFVRTDLPLEVIIHDPIPVESIMNQDDKEVIEKVKSVIAQDYSLS